MDFLTIQEVAEILKVHTNTAYKLCREGTLPAVKIGKEWRVDREKLGRFMEQGIGKEPKRLAPDSQPPALPQQGHVLGIFSDQDSIWEFERDFFLSAYSQGGRMLKACWWQKPAEVRRALDASGLPVAKMEAEDDLVILELSRYFEQYGPVGAAGAWFKEIVRSSEKNHRCLYGSGSPDFDCCRSHEGLLEFERALDQMLKGMPILGVCSYLWPNGTSQGLKEIIDLVNLHDQFFLYADHQKIMAQRVAS